MFQLTGGRYWSFRESGNDLQLYSGSNAAVPFMIDGDNSDRIGIGTTSPTQMLDVNGTVELNNLTVAGAQGSDGQVLTSTGSGVAWEAVDSGVTASKAIAFSILYS